MNGNLQSEKGGGASNAPIGGITALAHVANAANVSENPAPRIGYKGVVFIVDRFGDRLKHVNPRNVRQWNKTGDAARGSSPEAVMSLVSIFGGVVFGRDD